MSRRSSAGCPSTGGRPAAWGPRSPARLPTPPHGRRSPRPGSAGHGQVTPYASRLPAAGHGAGTARPGLPGQAAMSAWRMSVPAGACTVAQLPGTVRQTTGRHLRRCCIARIGAQEVTDVSHTDDNARAGTGPAGGSGPRDVGNGAPDRGAGHPRPDGKATTPPGGMRGHASPAARLPGSLSRRAFVGGVAGAAGLGLAACSSGLKGGSSTSTGTIKMGFISPVTGPDAPFATANPFVLKKVREAFAKGLTIGGKKYNVEIFTADSQSSDSRAAQVAQQLITQNSVDIMLTTSAPETVNPVSDQCEAAHVPCLGTIVPWQAWFLGRGGKIGSTAATSTSF